MAFSVLRVRDDAKTAASSSRLVPLVSTLASRVDFSSIAPPDADDAGQAVGKRFGRLKTSLGHGKLRSSIASGRPPQQSLSRQVSLRELQRTLLDMRKRLSPTVYTLVVRP